MSYEDAHTAFAGADGGSAPSFDITQRHIYLPMIGLGVGAAISAFLPPTKALVLGGMESVLGAGLLAYGWKKEFQVFTHNPTPFTDVSSVLLSTGFASLVVGGIRNLLE